MWTILKNLQRMRRHFRKLFKGRELEASAIEAFTAKKKLEAQRQELKSFINFHYGANSWNEIFENGSRNKKETSTRHL